MRNKIFYTALLLLMIAAAGAWAQNLPANIWASPQSNATEGRYRSNADDFIRPDAYTGVKFDKWFGMVSFHNTLATTGFGTTAGSVYIGALYSGNFWTNKPANNYIEQSFDAATVPPGGIEDKTYNVYNTAPSVAAGPENNIAVLIGAANMGFRLTYRTNHQSFNDSGIVTGNQVYNSYQAERGYRAPQIAWAMAKDLTGNGIRPYVTVDLVFDRDYQMVETSDVDAAGFTGKNTMRSLNRIDPAVAVGMGGFTFYNKDGFKGSFDFDYVFNMSIYDNEYSYEDSGVYKTGKIKGTYSSGPSSYVELASMSNSLTPSVSGSWSKDNLSLKFKLNLPLTFTNRERNNMDLDTDNKLVYEGNSDSTTTFSFRPDLRLALQYKLIPNRLILNTGARIQTTALTLETVDRQVYDKGDKVTEKSQKIHQNNYGGSLVSRFLVGPTLYFTENAWVEASAGVSNNTIKVFEPDGLFSFGSILVVLKF